MTAVYSLWGGGSGCAREQKRLRGSVGEIGHMLRSWVVYQQQENLSYLIPVFKPVKTYFHKLQHASIQMNARLCAYTLFVRNVTTAWVKAMKKECITNAWRACGLVPFDPQYFVDHIPSHRLRRPPADPLPTSPEPVASPSPPTPSSSPPLSQEDLSSVGPSASQVGQVERVSVGIPCTGRATMG